MWGPWNLGPPIGQVPGPLVVLLMAVGVFLTLRCRFVQVRRFPEALRTIFPKASGSRGVLSPFQAFMTALAASIGTGNIAGVATAVVAGGPGAVFWIWCYGFVATAIKFAEAVLGVSFRGIRDGTVLSGPMYYLRDGLKSPRLAWAYALIAGVAALTTTPFTQPNSIAVALKSEFSVNPWVSGVAIAVLTWLVIIGGVTSIGRAVEKLSPLKVGLYLAGGLFVIVVNAARLPEVFASIFREAFSLRAATGTAAGMALMVGMRYGLARGVYANEAGYGTAAVAYGTARSDYPAQQGLNAVIEVFTVSFLTSSISALTILVTGVWTSGLNSTAAVARRLQQRDSGGRWLDRRALRLSVRLHDAHRVGLLRRAVLRVHPRRPGDEDLSLDLLPADRLRRDGEGRDRVGLGRPDERPAGVPERHRPGGFERAGRHGGQEPQPGRPFLEP